MSINHNTARLAIYHAGVLSLILRMCLPEAIAGEEWNFDGITIRESTDVYERAALSTAGRPSGASFISQGNLTLLLSFRNSWALFSYEYRTYGLAAYEYDSNANPIIEAYAPAHGNPNGLNLLDLFVAQPLPYNFTAAAAAMPSCLGDGSLRLFTEIQNHPGLWLLSIMYDYWGGSAHNTTSIWGPFSSFDQLVFQVGYSF
jgi:hypothetical protein